MIYENKVTDKEAQWITNFLAPIEYDPKLQGQTVFKKKIKIGPWAGPEATLSNVLHEISHFVEIDESRMVKDGWGLKYPRPQHLLGQTFIEFQKPYHIERERRVWAFQLNLHHKFGIDEGVEDFADAAWFLDGFGYMIEEHRGKTTTQQKMCFAKSIEKLAEETQYSFESFLSEFNRRKNLLIKKSN